VSGYFDSLDPATGAVIGTFAAMDAAEVEAAVARARTAAAWWAGLAFQQRRRRLLTWNAWIWRHRRELSDLIHAENGKPREDATLETAIALEHVRWAARNAEHVLRPRRLARSLILVNHSARLYHLPLGVVGVIGPWNYPVFTPMGSIAYALAAGNAVVYKPSEYGPAVGRWLVRSFAAANPDAPSGVLALVTGDGRAGAALCAAGTDKIAFTGSTPTGRKVMEACARTLTPVTLECGGKDAVLVLPDADLAQAARAVAWGAVSNGGQTCAGVERVYVVEEVRDRFVELLCAELDGVRPGSDEGAHYGPMTTAEQETIVRRHVSDAVARGGRIVHGLEDPGPGRYLPPVVILDAPEDCLAVQEETFGPTVTVCTVGDADEAVERANASRFGLAAAVFGTRGVQEVARRLDVGAVTVNSVISFVGIPEVPMGGRRDSGFGRIHGEEGLLAFTRSLGTTDKQFSVPGLDLQQIKRGPLPVAALVALSTLRNRVPRR
jgi:aldehyde dehydrogenase (NAD+)